MNKWNFYTTNQIRPAGWVKRQLEIQAEGLSGNLDKVWRDVRDSAWIGGDAEGWERVPYWLDGFIPLAYLLENEDMIARAKKYIDAILSYQREDGWICPCTEEEIPTYDTWAVQLISKVLVVYYECSGDERIPATLYRVLKNYYDLLSSGRISLFHWGKYRWFETFVAIRFLKERYDESWITELAKILKAQGADYSSMTELWKKPLNKWTYDTHIVNLAMMLKYEAISSEVLGDEYTSEADRLEAYLRAYNGTPVGLFTGDECLSGLSAIQGTELCAVAEQMYSYEWLLACTGDFKWAEELELLAFNALPATISDDMWTHQYLQLSNQIACRKFNNRTLFRTNGREAHLFGLEPNFGCCTANFNQAWPKLAISAFMHKDNSILSAVLIPSTLDSETARVSLKTNYPFENKLEYTIDAKKDTRLYVRIPAGAKSLSVNGESHTCTDVLCFDVAKGTSRSIEISFELLPVMIQRPHDLISIRCGSLVFSLPISYKAEMIEYEKDGVERKFPYCDYEYVPTSDWNYAYSSVCFDVERREVDSIPFSSENPAVVIKAHAKKIVWGYEDGYDTVCAKVPESRTPISEDQVVELYPYGCAKLRMTELPLI